MAGAEPSARRRVLVVGAAQGIGRATAEGFATAGHHVTATWNRAEPADRGALAWRRCDITDRASVDAVFDEARQADAPFEVVVANAAVVHDRMAARMTDDDFAAVVDVNLTGTFRVARAALADMAGARWGRLVLVSSVGGWYGNAGQSNYSASKMGLLGMARSLAREVGPRGVTVNVVSPGPVDTELIAGMNAKMIERWLRLVPAQRMGRPAEIASAIGFLASEGAGFITGTMVPVDGGFLA